MGHIESKTVGIVSAPGFSAKLVYNIKDQLKDILKKEIPTVAHWEVDVEIDHLTGSANSVKDIMNETNLLREKNDWNYAISLTDLPVFYDKYVVIADANITKKIAQITLPAFGIKPTIKKVQLTILKMIKELHYRSLYKPDDLQLSEEGIGIKQSISDQRFFYKVKDLFSLSRVRRIELPEIKDGVSVRFLIKPLIGRIPLVLSGMTMANQPWKIMPSFKKVVGLAFATGSYMLIFPTLWKLSHAYGGIRIVLLMLFAISGMTIWIIFTHNLWEKKDPDKVNGLRYIYNASTVFTLLASIIIFYISLFILFLFAVIIFVPPQTFKDVIGEEVDISNYLALTWIVTSAATIAGTIGAGLENEGEVKKSTYGYRQYIRFKEVERLEEIEKEKQESDS